MTADENHYAVLRTHN